MRSKQIVFGVIVSVMFLTSSMVPAYAYIDPSTVSIVLQALVGASVAGAGAASLFWTSIKRRLPFLRPERKTATCRHDDDTAQDAESRGAEH